ncbi:hypothetical protein EYZ11_010153 [Aspergillus tanneri]|nr:hypothetical protein EYZ11_010153 [Aspergillus tanneri]
MTAWLLIHLASNPEWMDRVRTEVDSSLVRHSTGQETPQLVLSRLDLEIWEYEFPSIDLCLRESIRLHFLGSVYRRNCGDKGIPIGETGEVIPRGAFAFLLVDDVHFNPAIYPDPNKWDPGRYLADRAEDKKVPLGFVGWGAGRNPCLGMRYAKLSVTIMVALFISLFDFTLCDEQGNPMAHPPQPDRKEQNDARPKTPARLKCTVRKSV